ncbi:MAG: glycosyltransferase [Candidatus Lokiarchaeota archaeon]|nr:glycosyltransferase [Candidatus Lokiarchaeota archaeon]
MAIKPKLWITTFEFGPAKLGGLGEVPTNQAKHLGDDVDITVLMPAHGLVHGPLAGDIHSRRLDYELRYTQPFAGIIDDPSNHFLDGYPSKARVTVSLHELALPGMKARVLAFAGGDERERRILDDPVIYSTTGLRAKIAVFSRALREFMLHEAKAGNIPDAIHLHDYHAVPGVIGARQALLDRGTDVATILTIHLLTGPKVTMEYLACCGVADKPLPFTIQGRKVETGMSDLVTLCKSRLERIAAYVADTVTSVSRSYLEENVIPGCGGDVLQGKTDFIYNGCDWEHDEIIGAVRKTIQTEYAAFFGRKPKKPATRQELRRFLSTWKLGNLPAGEPAIPDPELLQIIKGYDGMAPFTRDGRTTSFPSDGKLCILTGRTSVQKGIDVLLDAVPRAIEEYPGLNFLLFNLPTQGEKALIKPYIDLAIEPRVRDHVRYVFGNAPSIYRLAHVAADLYVGPSRWEPFGIMILEANAVGLPAIGAGVGGIKETIVDVRENDTEGTGLLIEKESPDALAGSIVDMARAIDACEANDPSIAVHISDTKLKRAVIKRPGLYDSMRGNARARVEASFRWAQVSRKEIQVLQQAMATKNARGT